MGEGKGQRAGKAGRRKRQDGMGIRTSIGSGWAGFKWDPQDGARGAGSRVQKAVTRQPCGSGRRPVTEEQDVGLLWQVVGSVVGHRARCFFQELLKGGWSG